MGDPNRVSPIILSVSPCRSGTTVLLRVFGSAGVQAHFQEIKNVLRWQLQGQEAKWSIPQKTDVRVFLKETLGPYTEAESGFNPLDVLLAAGFPPAKLQVLIVGRTPLSTWASWYHWWGQVTSVDQFILSYETTELIRHQARHQGLPVTTLVYEAIRDNGVEMVVRRLFERLDVPFSPTTVKEWQALPPFGAPGSNIVFPIEPPIFVVPGIHEPAIKADGLVYSSRERDIAQLKAQDVRRIGQATLASTYEKWRLACVQNLHLSIERDQDWKHTNVEF